MSVYNTFYFKILHVITNVRDGNHVLTNVTVSGDVLTQNPVGVMRISLIPEITGCGQIINTFK